MKGRFTVVFRLLVYVYVFTRSTVELQSLFEGDTCETPDKKIGTCRLLSSCNEIYLAVIKNNVENPYKRCSFFKQEEVVCCPNTISIGDRVDTKRPSEAACDVYKSKTDNQFYILKGTPAARDEFPHMVALGTKDTDGKTNYVCGGALISERYVLTAAHCVKSRAYDIDHVRLGVTKLDDVDNASDIEIEEIIVHPDYKASLHYNDIALIRLDTWVGNKRPVCLSVDIPIFTPATELVATGWGVIDIKTNKRSNDLLKVTINYVDRDKCDAIYRENLDRQISQGILTSQLCALDNNGGDACQGDSGGPLHAVSKGATRSAVELIGVVSFGSFCGSSFPGVYASVPFYLDWIESVVWKK